MQAYERLENLFEEWAQVDNAVACSSGTSAIQLAIEALQLPKGSTVLIPEFCMIAIPRAVKMAGLQVKTIDIELKRLNIDPELLPDQINNYQEPASDMEYNLPQSPYQNVSAIIVVSTYGRAANSLVFDWANLHNIPVIEDLAEAHGVHPDYRSAAYCWSFYKNKIICGEEGGLVAFKEKEVADRARSLRCMGFNSEHDFLHRPGGFNARMSNAHAEIILQSLAQADNNLKKREDMVDLYASLISQEFWMTERDVNWVYDIQFPHGHRLRNRAEDMAVAMRVCGARMSFKPVTRQLEFLAKSPRLGMKEPLWTWTEAHTASQNVFYLPLIPNQYAFDEVETAAKLFNRLVNTL